MKRKLEEVQEEGDISQKFLTECEEKFKADPKNTISRNAINAVGSMIATTNSNRVNEISHVFLNTVKKKNLKATNQGASGRCWMFSALNAFRHVLINALQLEDFEFSEVYLFFWDKLERSNSYLRWFIEHPQYTQEDRAFEYMVDDYMNDGGWWSTFANLADKYGLVPMGAMKETYQSDDSEDMNRIIKEHLDSTVNHIGKIREKSTLEELHKIREQTVAKIYEVLVKFLGEPSKKFNWSFTRDEEDSGVVTKVTPKMFLNMVAPDVSMRNDFITLVHVPMPHLKMYQKYRIRYTNNVYEGENCTFFNVPIHELAKYAMNSISKGMAVWVAADVRQSFNFFHSTLDDKLDDHKTVFGDTYPMDKGERLAMRNVQTCHAMCLTGFNIDEHGKPIAWQTENSWGYFDKETPGLDGFLYMSHSWFEKYVTEIVVNKEFLSRTMRKKISESEPIDIDPWDSMAPSLKIVGRKVPERYMKMMEKKSRQ